MSKDSVWGTFTVAVVLCLACSVLVAGSAVYFKPMQDANREFDVKKNMLLASGLISGSKVDKDTVLKVYERVQRKVVDLSTGEVVENPPANFVQRKAAKDPQQNMKISKDKDLAGIKVRSKLAEVFEVAENGKVAMYILPVHGKGLWSTMYGFLAVSADLTTIKGLGFYQHGETPGLGGEVDNPNWKAQWVGKKLFGDNLQPKVEVLKGAVSASDPLKDYRVDGLSGATITSNGVTKLIHYWLGDDAFGPFLKRVAAAGGQ